MLKSLFQWMKNKSPGEQPPARPQILLAAFGKHPGRDEHFNDLQQQPRLVNLWDALYTRGIRTLVDSGRWSDLEKAGQLQPFNHILAGVAGSDVLVGRIWSSSDSLGRDR